MNDKREPDETNVLIDADSCEVMEGHQHEAVDIEQLADSIVALGQINPVQILEYQDGRRLIAAGRRRWMACKSRGIGLLANIWKCEEDDINLELFAKAIRIAENVERRNPSAMDVAKQLQVIRNERGFKNAREIGEHLGMSESSVKRYLSVFRASDYLQEMAQQHELPIFMMLELTKCEKKLGVTATRKLIDKAVKGELAGRDLALLRARSGSKKAKDATKGPARKKKTINLRDSRKALWEAIEADPDESTIFVEELIAELSQFLTLPRSSTVELLGG